MKKMILTTVSFLISSSTVFAAPAAMKIRVNDAETLYKASVSMEQMDNNVATLHIHNGKVVARETAKEAFLNGETSCRVLLNDQIALAPLASQSTLELVMEIPTENRKLLVFADKDQTTLFALICQAQTSEVTRSSILKTLGSLVEKIESSTSGETQ